jgi:hypothetical protein
MGERSGGGRHCLYQGKEEGRLRLALFFLRGGHHAQGTIPSIRLRAGELSLLERLEGKYRPRQKDLEDSPAPQVPEGNRTAVEPVQGLLFFS